MPFRFPLRTVLGAALCSIPLAIVACGGRGPLDTDIEAYDVPDAPGLASGDDGVAPLTDSGASSGETPDAAKDSEKDAGLPGLPGFPGLPGLGIDAGPVGECFSCAQAMCGTQVTACVSNLTCVEEGLCDVTTCLGGAGTTGGGTAGAGGLGGLDLSCLQKCGSDQQASSELMSALLCVFTSCGTTCLGAVTSLGAGGGGLSGFPGLTSPMTK